MALNTHELAQRFVAALQALEREGEAALEPMVRQFSAMSRLTNAALKRSGTERTGESGAREFWSDYRRSFRDVRTEFYEVTCGERSAGLFWTTRGSSATGAPLEYDGATLLVFEDDGQITQFRGYYDTRELELRADGSAHGERAGAAPH